MVGRTESIEKQLKVAGIGAEKIKSLKGKPKKKKKKKKKMGIITRAAKGLKSVFGPGHSPAGRRYLVGKVRKYSK